MKGIAVVASQMTVGTRLYALVALLCGIAIVVGLTGLAGMQRSNRALETVYRDRVIPLQQLKTITDTYDDSVIDAVNKANVGLLSAEDALQALRAARGRIKQVWAAYQTTYFTEEESRLAAEANQLFVNADREVARVEQALATKHGRIRGELTNLEGPLYAAVGPIHGKVTELADLQLRVAKAEYDKAHVDYGRVRAFSLGLLTVGILLGAFLGYRIVRDLLRQLGGEPSYAAAIANRVAGGDLSAPIVLKKGDTGSLLFAMRNMVAKLAQIRTEQEHAKAALAESEARYRQQAAELEAIYRDAPVGLCVLDRELRFVRINARLAEINGVPAAAHLGKTVREVLPQLADQAEPLLHRVLATGEPALNHELSGETPAQPGVRRHWIEQWLPLKDDEGAIIGVNVVTEEVTARKRMEAELKRSEERYRIVAEYNYDWEYWLAPDGALRYVSPSCEMVSGYRPEAFIADPTLFTRIVHPDDAAAFERHLRDTQEGHDIASLDFRILRRDSAVRWVNHVCRPVFGADGEYLGRRVSNRDITERKQAEEALREADRHKDEFLATLAHELRNPLAPISNALQLLKRSDDRPIIERALGMAERQMGQLTRLVDDLLDVSRITRGKVTLHKEQVALSAVIQSALETSRPHIEAGGHRLTVELPEEPIRLEADLTRLAQAVSNLLINAAKFTEPGGQIRLTARCVGEEVAITVQDTGIGIPEAELPKVFELFVQVKQPHRRAAGGLGIGLALVKSLVELHGGRVEAASAGPGQGSTFTIRLPLAMDRPAAEPTVKEQEGAAAPAPTRRILVVDDDEDVANSTAMLLQAYGHEVHVAYDGATAIAEVRAHRPEVVLLDIGMPGMDGYEVARRLRELPELQGMRLIALTGWGQEEDRRRSGTAGFDHHLVKPVAIKTLEALLSDDIKPVVARRPTEAG